MVDIGDFGYSIFDEWKAGENAYVEVSKINYRCCDVQLFEGKLYAFDISRIYM